jgi:hypothetical protein
VGEREEKSVRGDGREVADQQRGTQLHAGGDAHHPVEDAKHDRRADAERDRGGGQQRRAGQRLAALGRGGGAFGAGHAQEGDAERPREGADRRAAGEGQARPGGDDQDADQVAGDPEPLEQPLEDQPFADEAVERWQHGQAERADEGQQGGGGQPLGQAAQPVHVAGAGGVLDHAGLQEQQGLAGAVVDHVVQRRQQQEGRERPLSVGGEGE